MEGSEGRIDNSWGKTEEFKINTYAREREQRS